MLRVFYHDEIEIRKSEEAGCLRQISPEKILWVDLQHPTDDEKDEIQLHFNIDFDELKAENEMESNARFYESEELVFIMAHFIATQDDHYESTQAFFYMTGNVLITERTADLTSFAETIKKMKRNRKGFKNGSDVLEVIFETKFDIDADFIEQIAKDIAAISRSLPQKSNAEMENMLLKISDYQEATTLSRESFADKQRVASALLKSNVFEDKERLRLLTKDINGMMEYTSFIFARLEYLQNTILGLINIEQNKTIKIFTIVAVVFMPPTLIASIYGMNFKIPELGWDYGYPFAILLIIGSSLLTLYIFKRKKWL